MTMESKIQKFELKNCRTEKKCLKLTADKAQSSQFLPLYVLKNIKMELQQAEKTKTFEALTGYIDFNQDTVQLDLKNGDELLLDLKTLEEKNFYKWKLNI